MKKFFLFLMTAVALMACTNSNEPNFENIFGFRTITDIIQLYQQGSQEAGAQILTWEGWEYDGDYYSKDMSPEFGEGIEIIEFDNDMSYIEYGIGTTHHKEMFNWFKAQGSQAKLDGEMYKFHHAERLDEPQIFARDYKKAISYIDELSSEDGYEVILRFWTDQEAAYYDKNGKHSENAKEIILYFGEEVPECSAAIMIEDIHEYIRCIE